MVFNFSTISIYTGMFWHCCLKRAMGEDVLCLLCDLMAYYCYVMLPIHMDDHRMSMAVWGYTMSTYSIVSTVDCSIITYCFPDFPFLPWKYKNICIFCDSQYWDGVGSFMNGKDPCISRYPYHGMAGQRRKEPGISWRHMFIAWKLPVLPS